MELDLAELLQGSDALLLFTVLAFGLLMGRMKVGGFEVGTTAGVLLVALLFGNWGFEFSVQTESLGFMLFIFCVGIEAGPNFFSTFAQDGVRYVAIALVVAMTGVLVTIAVAFSLNLEPALAAGMLAGALTSTPTLVGAQDAVSHRPDKCRLRHDIRGGPGGFAADPALFSAHARGTGAGRGAEDRRRPRAFYQPQT